MKRTDRKMYHITQEKQKIQKHKNTLKTDGQY